MTTRHEPRVVPRVKMDTPSGLWVGACSCGWVGLGLDSKTRAMRSAEQHATAKNNNTEKGQDDAGGIYVRSTPDE